MLQSEGWHQAALAVLVLLCLAECPAPNVFAPFGIAKFKIAEDEIRSMVEQVELYRETKSGLPQDLTDLAKAGYLKNAQEDGTVLDPWKRAYCYELAPGTALGFVIFSRGEDPSSEEDDIRSDELDKKP